MVVLIKKFTNFPHKSKPKLDHSQSTALQTFNSTISENLHKLFSDKKNGLNCSPLSLSWYIPCFKFIQGMNRAFAKLVQNLDYPVDKWKGNLAEDYLSHTLMILDALNSISSSISHVGIARLSLNHALSLIQQSQSSAIHHLKPINLKKNEIKGFNYKEVCDKIFDCGKEKAIHEAMMKMKNVDMLIMKILLCGLWGERNGDLNLNWEELKGFDLGFGDNYMKIKEIEEVNEGVKKVKACLVGEEKCNKFVASEELKMKLSELENLTEIVGKEVNCLFSEVFARRNELINCFRLPNCN